MVFKNETQLKGFILQKCRVALARTQEQVYKILDIYMQRFYADYDPVWYNRTYQLMKSLVKSDIKSTKNGYEAYVYFDIDGLSYTTGSKPSMEQVVDAAAHGGHGATGLKVVPAGGEDIWWTPLEILDAEAIEILKSMLIAEGIPIVKG